VTATVGQVPGIVGQVPRIVGRVPVIVGKRRGRLSRSIIHASHLIEPYLVPQTYFTDGLEMSDGLRLDNLYHIKYSCT
jgi:hypothetical protein